MRKKNSLRNILISITGQIITIFVAFFSRSIFLKYLGTEYLGLNGLFSNILSMLSLVDLGIGPAIIFSLYAPLAKNDEKAIGALLSFYKKVYFVIGFSIIALGLLVTPFITFFISGDINVDVNLYIVFLLFLLNTSITYFISYKKNLLIADQKQYLVDSVQYFFQLSVSIIRIIILILTRNYYLYLIVQIISVVLDCLYINHIVQKRYPFINNYKKEKIKKDVKNEIIKNTKAMIFDKIGGIAVSSTDNLLMSKLVNLSSVGIYSNYYLIISSLKTLINQIFNGVTASVGNFCVKNTKQQSIEIFNVSYFVSYIIYSFSACCLLSLFNPFIELWIGKNYIFSMPIVLTLVINFYLNGMRSSTSIFNNAYGLYWQQRYRPLIEAILNLVISIVLGIKYGTLGIFIGTTITTIFCCTLVEPYIVFKYGFESDSKKYYNQYIKYGILTIFISVICYISCQLIGVNGIGGFIIKLALCLFIPNCINILIFRNKKEYLYLKETFINLLKHIKK